MNLYAFDGRWFALQVRCGWEQRCAQALHNKGYEEFLPTSRAERFPNRERVRAHQGSGLLFPGYLFCRLRRDVTSPVVTTPGVIRIVGFGGAPAPISDAEISNIKSLLDLGRPPAAHPYIGVGQKVRIITGPFRD